MLNDTSYVHMRLDSNFQTVASPFVCTTVQRLFTSYRALRDSKSLVNNVKGSPREKLEIEKNLAYAQYQKE